jgi:uncharacterized membrane protein
MSLGKPNASRKRSSPTYFFLRGLAIILPPVLTMLILLWIAGGFSTYVIQPVNTAVRYALALFIYSDQIKTTSDLVEPRPGLPALPDWNREYRVTKTFDQALLQKHTAAALSRRGALALDELLVDDAAQSIYVPMGKTSEPGSYVSLEDYDLVFKHLRPQPPPTTAIGLYMEIAAVRWFKTSWNLSLFALSLSIIALYFLGRMVTARLGGWFYGKFELLLTRLPVVRNVYSTVKQVTDFVLSEREVDFKRVVAIEYPRSGSWTLGFVTGEGILDCAAEVGEAMVTVLVPTSPMPMGGFTVMLPRSQVIDLSLTVDQAVQFIVSCGVLTPPGQRVTPEGLEQQLQKRSQGAPLVESAGASA